MESYSRFQLGYSIFCYGGYLEDDHNPKEIIFASKSLM